MSAVPSTSSRWVTSLDAATRRAVIQWLLLNCALIVGMVVVGGITRLTHSGLSIVEWKPVTGVLPPLSESAWTAEFRKYQQYPQFRLQFGGQMTLDQFKSIFFWEWFHRLLGRFIGLAFAGPLVWFYVRRRLTQPLFRRLLVGLALGGFQGVLGWFMVKSGLVDMPRVSHYRLAAHLLTAFVALGYLLWIAMDLFSETRERTTANSRWRTLALVFLVGLLVQITWGAFTAGLRAGYGYPTWPMMNGAWVPPGFWSSTPSWASPMQNPPAVQFVHRTLGALVLVSALVLMTAGLRSGATGRARLAWLLLGSLTCLQFVLGVLTVIWSMPIPVAALHQSGGCLLFCVTLFVLHSLQWKESSAVLMPERVVAVAGAAG